MNRIDRLTAILIQLQSKRVVKVQDEISLRTVYRDIRALEEASVPIGAKLVSKMGDASLNESFESALYKIKSVLKRSEKEHLEDLNSRVAVLNHRRQQSFSEYLLHQIQQAIVHQHVLLMYYVSNYQP